MRIGHILILGILLVSLIGCEIHKDKISKKELDSTKKLTPSKSDHDDTSLTPYTVIEKTLYGIHNDLKKLKPNFPQLTDINNATIKNNRFDYEKGFLEDSKIKGPTFEKNGCDIFVEIKYPATPEDIRQLKGSPLLPLKNGNFLKFWRLVRAEQNKQGETFTKKVNEIISFRLNSMLKELEELD